jgi:hypothetical protein
LDGIRRLEDGVRGEPVIGEKPPAASDEAWIFVRTMADGILPRIAGAPLPFTFTARDRFLPVPSPPYRKIRFDKRSRNAEKHAVT